VAEDSPAPLLPRRVPGGNRLTPGDRQGTSPRGPLVLPESVLERIRTALESETDEASPRPHEARLREADAPAPEDEATPPGDAVPAERPASLPRREPRRDRGSEPPAHTGRRGRSDRAQAQPIPLITAAAPSEVKAETEVRPDISGEPGPAAAGPAGSELVPAQRSGQSSPRNAQASSGNGPALQTGVPTQPPRSAPPQVAFPPPEPVRLRQRGHRGRKAAVLILVIILSAGGAAFLLTRNGGPVLARPTASGASTEAAIRNRAAAWVASQVSPTAHISCDQVMCQALEAHGMPATALIVLRPGGAGTLRSAVIVATAAVRNMVGSRLLIDDAPAAIASFGSGSGQISIRVVVPGGAAAYSSTLRSDIAARKDGGTSLLQNPRITVSARARPQLAGGQVDSRLMLTVAIMAAKWPVSIVAFGDIGPDASQGVPLRSADLVPATSAAGSQVTVLLQQMSAFLHTSPGSYPVSHVSIVKTAGGRDVLRIEFAAPSPPGVLAG
jgi:hypothetical protein